MGVVTKYKLAEQIISLIDGGDLGAASSVSLNQIKVSIGQVINKMLKVDYFSTNLPMGETIQNGAVLGLYEDLTVQSWNGKSKCTLPIKPLKLPRNMGVFAVYGKYSANGNYELDKEFIPLQMGQGGLIQSQPLINNLLGQIGYETFGMELIFTKDLPAVYPYVRVALRLAILDMEQYDDYDSLPVMPEMEMDIVKEVYQLYSTQPIADKVVDSTTKEQKGIPVNQQKQAP